MRLERVEDPGSYLTHFRAETLLMEATPEYVRALRDYIPSPAWDLPGMRWERFGAQFSIDDLMVVSAGKDMLPRMLEIQEQKLRRQVGEKLVDWLMGPPQFGAAPAAE